MKIKLCVSVVFAFLLVCGVSAFAQLDLNEDGNINLVNPDKAYQIQGNNVLRVYQTSVQGSNLYLGKGAGALSNPLGNPNTFLGNFAGNNYVSKSGGDTYVGYAAGSNNATGYGNTYIGYKAAGANQIGGSGSGNSNTFLGFQAGLFNTGGSENTFLGSSAGTGNTTGTRNVFIGIATGAQNRTGSHNIYISNYYPYGPPNDESNTLRIGVPYQGCYHGCGIKAAYVAGIYGASTTSGTAVYVDSTGKLGTDPGFNPLGEMQDTIRSQAERIADLEQRLARLEAMMERK